MYAVIFRAEIAVLDDEYYTSAKQLKELAETKYGCLDFTSVTEGNQEIAISYWSDKKQILAWKNDEHHLAMQILGKERWYKSYKVQVVEIEREYCSN